MPDHTHVIVYDNFGFTADCQCGADHAMIIADRCSVDGTCWRWRRRIDRYGYGVATHQGSKWRAHRLAYIAYIGAISDGLVIDHLCRNRWCVNPAHLEAVTNLENLKRGNIFDPEWQAQQPRVANKGILHGRRNTYSRYGCRCDACTAANTAACRAYAHRRRLSESSES